MAYLGSCKYVDLGVGQKEKESEEREEYSYFPCIRGIKIRGFTLTGIQDELSKLCG
jgi:hypothetical protein